MDSATLETKEIPPVNATSEPSQPTATSKDAAHPQAQSPVNVVAVATATVSILSYRYSYQVLGVLVFVALIVGFLLYRRRKARATARR